MEHANHVLQVKTKLIVQAMSILANARVYL